MLVLSSIIIIGALGFNIVDVQADVIHGLALAYLSGKINGVRSSYGDSANGKFQLYF